MSRIAALCGLTALLIVGFVIGKAFWRRREQPSPSSASVPPIAKPLRAADPHELDFVGSATCAKCHGAIADAYRRHPMANSTQSLEHGRPKTSGVVRAMPAGATFLAERGPAGIVHVERYTAANGSTLAGRVVPVHYAIGSGAHGQSFLGQREGLLFISPLSWYANGDRWDLSPGFESASESRFDRQVGGCVFCHAGRAAPVAGEALHRYRQPPFQELSIGCERCHGPGREHVELYESDRTATASESKIVNPARLDPQRQDHVCCQCHLSGLFVVLRHDRQFSDFQPGQLLDDVWTVLVSDETVGSDSRTKAVSQVEQIRSSRCYTASRGRLVCISCHDPHRTPDPDQKVEHYRSRCQNCHADRSCSVALAEREASSARNSCAACHMPRLDTEEIAHTALTDHRILRAPAVRNEPESSAPPTRQPFHFFDGAENRLPNWEVKRVRGIALMRLASERHSTALLPEARSCLEQSLQTAPDDAEVLFWLAMHSSAVQTLPQARKYLESFLKLQPRHEEGLAMFGHLCHQMGDYQTALQTFDRLRQIDPWRADILPRQAEMRLAFGDLPGAIEAIQRAVDLDPEKVELRSLLADYLHRDGQSEESRRQREIAKAIRNLQVRSEPYH